MGFLSRIKNIVQAHANAALDDEEAKHADVLAQQDIRKLDTALADATSAAAQLGAEAQALGDQRTKLQAEIDRWQSVAQKEATVNENLARQALARKLDAANQLASTEQAWQDLTARFETAKNRVIEDTQRLEAAKRSVRTASVRKQAIDAGDKADHLFGDLNDHESLFTHIETLESQITNQERTSEIRRSISDDASGATLQREADKLGRDAAIDAELAKLKAPPAPQTPSA